MVTVGALVLAGDLAGLGVETAHRPVPAAKTGLASWLAAHRLFYGLGGYWEASIVTVDSGGRVKVRALAQPSLVADMWEAKRSWYDPGAPATFTGRDSEPGLPEHREPVALSAATSVSHRAIPVRPVHGAGLGQEPADEHLPARHIRSRARVAPRPSSAWHGLSARTGIGSLDVPRRGEGTCDRRTRQACEAATPGAPIAPRRSGSVVAPGGSGRCRSRSCSRRRPSDPVPVHQRSTSAVTCRELDPDPAGDALHPAGRQLLPRGFQPSGAGLYVRAGVRQRYYWSARGAYRVELPHARHLRAEQRHDGAGRAGDARRGPARCAARRPAWWSS